MAGFASLISDHFRAPTHDVRLYSRTKDDGFGSLADLEQSASYDGADTVLHLAWSSLPATSEQNPRKEWQNDLPLLEKMLASHDCP